MQWRGWLILLCIEIFSQSYWKLPMSSNAIFFGERHFARKYLLPKNIASSRLVAPGSPWMHSALEINCVRIKEGKQVLILCFVKKTLEKMFYLLVSHTNAHAIRSKPTPKYHERFRNGSIHEFHFLKEMKTLKEVDTSDLQKEKSRKIVFETKNNKQIVMQDKGLNDSI